MEMSSSDCVALDAASKVLAKSRAVQSLVKKSVGATRFSDALTLMKTGRLEGDLGADIHDLLADAIRNDAKEVWSGLIRQPHDDYPIQVNEFHGVFWVWAMEYDPVGYFLSKQDAVSYARSNWDVTEGGR
jgi:hypothetical protein